ncbi:uncharacterized protein M421DRAFT_51816 [Didymella exigua CBS 183.55]|uniref:HTH psq-type domain-containing protein n=1 Tax=Didymella exigua CBS 183.55 TaxID=1150837 RepID=A0A6A5S2F1_9PLEO|nr:uncharacterized protein M421DRAFT_51816 [Didymella exigua CBS 183.55]KAF1933790.1 hypothetical protein M421DRAFT_51816 [Didymella exigua CBS 183.55]
MPLEEALAELDTLGPDDTLSYQALAKKHGYCRSTLTRCHRGVCASREDKAKDQLVLHPRDEVEIVQYVKSLTERHLMSTRKVLVRIITPLCRWPLSD